MTTENTPPVTTVPTPPSKKAPAPSKTKNKPRKKKGPALDENGCIVVPTPKVVGNKDQFGRLNYLYQLGMLHTIQGTPPISPVLARRYVANLDAISKKTKCSVLPNTKRTICKRCKQVLVPTKTCTFEVSGALGRRGRRTPKNETFTVRCSCGEVKRFRIGIDKNYRNFYEKPGNVIDMARK